MPLDPMRAAVLPQTTAEVLAILVTIDHPDLTAPLRLTSNGAAVSSRGELFTARGLRAALPTQRAGEMPRTNLEIADVDGAVARALAAVGLSAAMTALIELVFLSAPDVVQRQASAVVTAGPHHNQGVTTLELAGDNTSGEQYPCVFFNRQFSAVH